MSKKISVMIKEPGRIPRHVAISDTLENLQRTVGGYIETVTICSDAVLIVDEEGRIKGKEWCCNIAGIDLCGERERTVLLRSDSQRSERTRRDSHIPGAAGSRRSRTIRGDVGPVQEDEGRAECRDLTGI